MSRTAYMLLIVGFLAATQVVEARDGNEQKKIMRREASPPVLTPVKSQTREEHRRQQHLLAHKRKATKKEKEAQGEKKSSPSPGPAHDTSLNDQELLQEHKKVMRKEASFVLSPVKSETRAEHRRQQQEHRRQQHHVAHKRKARKKEKQQEKEAQQENKSSSSPVTAPLNYQELLLEEGQVNLTQLGAFYGLDELAASSGYVNDLIANAKGFICCPGRYPPDMTNGQWDDCYTECHSGRAEIEGGPLLQQQSLLPGHHHDTSLIPDKSMHFGDTTNSTHSERVLLPNNEEINTRDWGYADKTIELWFNADTLSDSVNHTIFSMGTEDTTGLSIYARGHSGSGTHSVDLFFYAWSRASLDQPAVQFGTRFINPEPIHCEADHGVDYYLAMVFRTHNDTGHIHSPTIHAYLRPADESHCSPSCSVTESLCGKMIRMPHHAVIGRSSGDDGRATIGGMMTTTRTCGHDTAECIMANDAAGTHNWRGTIDNVAIYNSALDEHVMQTHVDAAKNP